MSRILSKRQIKTMKKSIIPFIAILATVLVTTTCNDREDYFANANLGVTVALESPLTGCTESHPGFINLDYAFDITLTPEYSKANPLPLVAKFACENAAGNFILSMGNKPYTTNDTIVFKSLTKKMKLNVSKPGTYKFLIQFFRENSQDEILGQYEFAFVIGSPDLNMYIVRDGKRVENMDETANFLGYEGSFIVRVNSDKEDLNKGRLKLTAGITGGSVQVKNWKDRETKISQTDDLPETVDFLVEYKNVQTGRTKFVFTAQAQNSSATLKDSMTVREALPGSLVLQTAYSEEKDYYSREQLWVGQPDSVAYLITPDPKAVSDVFRMKFEMADPGKVWLFDSRDQHYGNHQYLANQWYDFSGRLNGKIYIISPSGASYSDTIKISLQNGGMGPITTYKLFVSYKQSDDFDFKATFKPELTDGYDVIKLSELTDGIVNPVVLAVNDENPYSKFDVELGFQNMNEAHRNIVQRATKIGHVNLDNLLYGRWIGMDYGYMNGENNTKNFKIVCLIAPTNQTASAYIEHPFNWSYNIKRLSDGKIKTVTRKIRIIDDRMAFSIDMAPGNTREWTYQNETVTAYQLKYGAPSLSADDYFLTVTSTDEAVADVYLVNRDLSFAKAIFGAMDGTPPASHNPGPNASMLSPGDIGKMQIKGKQPGTAVLSFTLKHKVSGASKTITKTVTTTADPVEYVIEPATTIDAMQKERAAVPFGGQFHSYQNPRFRIRLAKSKVYAPNTGGTATVVFSTAGTLTNVAVLKRDGMAVSYGEPVQMAYDTDYFITVASPAAHPWNVPAGAEQWLNIKMTKATGQETPIEAELNGAVRYTLRAYRKPAFEVTAAPASEGTNGQETVNEYSYPQYVREAGVIVSTGGGTVTETVRTGWFTAGSPEVSDAGTAWGDAHEESGTPYLTGNGELTEHFFVGNTLEQIPGMTPAQGWQYCNAVTVTYYSGVRATVRDNWGYSGETPLKIPAKVEFGFW
jgi:hypothetical protein